LENLTVNLPTSQGVAILRRPTPELIAIIIDDRQPMRKRWNAYLEADGFKLDDFPFDNMAIPYVNAEIQRVCRAIHDALPKHAS
jgi:hypothetical protein